MGKKGFKNYICRPFCRFFSEGKKEDMACRGAQIIELLVQRGRLKSKDLPLNGKAQYLWEKHDYDLETIACRNCPFFPDDCDFHSIQQLPYSEPCGGYILLRLLKQNGSITVVDLEETSDE